MGPAGSGKTSLSNAFGNWIKRNITEKVGFVNLDPAVDYLPYIPDIDVRNIVDIETIIKEEKLGPNGALVRAIHILSQKTGVIVSEISKLDKDYLIIDTPGQLDLFVFHDFGEKIISELVTTERSLGIFLWEPLGLDTPINAITLFLLTLAVRFRLQIPVVPVYSKIDLVRNYEKGTFYDSILRIKEKVEDEKGVISEFVSDLYHIMKSYSIPTRIIGISSKNGYGLDQLYGLIHEVFCTCGDLT